jgi:hypothetical protein
MDLQQETARIFDELFMVTFKELGLMGIQVEPSEVVKKIVSPVKDAYLKGLLDLLALMSQPDQEERPADEPG